MRRLLVCGMLALSLPACAAPLSTLFPYCWGGVGNEAVYYVQGLMTRQLVFYANPSDTEPVTACELVIDLPAEAVEVVKAVAADGWDRVKTDMTVTDIERDGRPWRRHVVSLWDIKPGFRWKGETPWSQWPGWWTSLYVRGGQPGQYAAYWHLRSAQGDEPEKMAPLVVLPRPARARQAAGSVQGLGVWNSLALYGYWPEVTDGLAETLAHCGVSRLYVNVRDAVLSAQSAHAAGLKVMLFNSWHYSYLAPVEPPDDCRARNERGEPIEGIAWCPTHVAERGAAWEDAVRPAVADDIKRTGADGFMLDYEGAAAPGYDACNICFCDRCREAFADVVGATADALTWPADVRPGGRHHARWLQWRQQQSALYVKHIADLAREARPGALTYTWSGGYYRPYPAHIQYSKACSDITRFTPYLTAPTVGTYVYPNDPVKALTGSPTFGQDPRDYGAGIPNMIDVIKWTVDALRPQPVIPCVSGGHTPGGSATPLASGDLLRYQVANHLLDGATGVDFWGTGPLDDGRYLVLMSELAELFAEASLYLGGVSAPLPKVGTEAARWRAGVLQSAEGKLGVVINGDAQERSFVLPLATGARTLSVPPYGVRLLSLDAG